MKYISPDLNAFDKRVTPADLTKAGTLLRLTEAPTFRDDKSLIQRVAIICASRGAEQALMWLDGFWYVTGTRRFFVTTTIQFILTLDVA